MRVLYVYNPAPQYFSRTQATQHVLRNWPTAIPILWTPVGADHRYETAVRQQWGCDDFIILEQDIVPTWGHVQGLAACPYPLCTVAYALNQPIAYDQFHGELVQRNYRSDGSRYWIPYGTEWADLTGLGFVRIRREWAQAHPPTWQSGVWSDLDARLSWWTYQQGVRWHVHYPLVRHQHYGEGYVPA